MKKLYLILLSVFALLNTAVAQELKVKSFSLDINDLTASTEIVQDKDGDPCALVKILVVDSIAKLEGSVLKIKKSGPTELWAYMYNGAKEIRIKPTHYKPLYVYFPNYGINGVEGKRTYILDLDASVLVSATLPVSSPTPKSASDPSGTVITIPVKDGISIDMVKVEARSFLVGPKKSLEAPRRVHLTENYYLGKYEVTQALWKAIMVNNPSVFKGDDLPVENVSWYDCHDFISKLNGMTGLKFRLPTEAEWRYAAMGANKKQYYHYCGGNIIDDVAWYDGNSGSKTHSVGTKLPNELGIYDMSGNVSEWCQDWSQEIYQRSFQKIKEKGYECVHYGGSWEDIDILCEPISPIGCSRQYHDKTLGFRLVLSE